MRAPAITLNKVALAFAVGSGVYFWYQFAALASMEAQLNTTLQPLGLNSLVTPNAATQATQQQAPLIAGAAALATLLLA